MSEIIVKFGYRKYIFYSKQDITKATSIYSHCVGDLNDFEKELENNQIDFAYELF